MRHKHSKTRLTQKPAHARMLLRNLVTSILLYESVRTTRSRARAAQALVDRIVHIAKTREPRSAIRSINQIVTDKNACRKAIEVFKARYSRRPSGYTRVKAAGSRQGDGAELVDISFVEGKDTQSS
ncbi:50S ribosomal protein L17 [Candidatus Peregrinibacteria bacterium CG10_big_fil_rev_8_21_14_0_10_49_16]|nr:MAG: 50S ribosomal protein L17 [Candidatus Peregrinibacteria bacterium CG22_combo_CG10-13_8_21_14_all_49_11]PIR51852.1 MAG: 50S ribosomal protein L17 [Candidatus Peregrinibacteria bacterium CG10_big_fil_rev_8_21_14_0_10_49_16]